MKLFKITFAIAIAACLLAATTVQATDRYSTGTSTDWFAATSWNTQPDGSGAAGVPQADDDVFVQNTHTIIVNDETAAVASVTVQNGGEFRLESTSSRSGVLVLDDALTVVSGGTCSFSESTSAHVPSVRSHSTIAMLSGQFSVSGTSGGAFDRESTAGFQLTSGLITSSAGPVTISAPIENDGTIRSTGEPITINSSVTNDGTIEASSGNVTVSGLLTNRATGVVRSNGSNLLCSADVLNSGTISAQNGTDVTFSGTINAGSAGRFQVTAANSDMTFNMSSGASITSNADFNVEAGRMYFAQTLSTNGGYRQIGGQLEVAAGKSFQASGTY